MPKAPLRDDALEMLRRPIDRLSRHYGGGQYPTRDRARVSAWIEIERWHGWGAYS